MTPAGIKPATFRFVAQRLNHCATAVPHYTKYFMKSLLGDFNAKLGREDINKPTIGNESLHEYSTDNGVRIVNL